MQRALIEEKLLAVRLNNMKILVIGAGRMGYGAVFDLTHNSPEVNSVTVADADFVKAEQVAKLADSSKITAKQLDVSDYEKTVSTMRGHDAAISRVNCFFLRCRAFFKSFAFRHHLRDD